MVNSRIPETFLGVLASFLAFSIIIITTIRFDFDDRWVILAVAFVFISMLTAFNRLT